MSPGGTIALLVAIAAVGVAVIALVLLTRDRRRLTRLVSTSAPGELPGGRPLDALETLLAGATREAQRREGEVAELAEALDSIPLGIAVCDQHAQIRFRNTVAGGFESARHGEALVEAAVTDLLARAVQGLSGRREVQLYGPPLRSFVVRARPLMVDDDEVRGGIAVIEDVSEQRRVDSVRRDFVANISHELKTPIGALGLLADTIREEDDPEVVTRLAERMILEADRVSHTVDDLMELSRIEFADESDFEALDIGSLVCEAVARIREAADQRAVKVLVHAGEAMAVRGDRRQLVSALFNLLDNAVKFSESGTTVEINTTGTPEVVQIAVIDAGPGIESKEQERIFERFYRVDQGRSRAQGGTGLGLAIVRHVASNHRGRIDVVSSEGEGSTFVLRLPRLVASGGDTGAER
ncbi:MAG: Signal-transduction histidine kinase senX3 [Acidimicrobiales bacterium]|nr:MAG: two-component sensor histidine kinase [Actinomycetota bacterium]MBV6509666.1 Signal-transduction histidine kinase senX3 [Acidimicrobiales bacterium]RIK06356.1 MAG: two-component sensor histidine kinase [Acidobacteriota bacterium]